MSRIPAPSAGFEDHDVQARLHEIFRDVGLQVGEAEHQSGFSSRILSVFATGRPRRAASRAARAAGAPYSRKSYDAPLLAKQIQRLVVSSVRQTIRSGKRAGIERRI